MEPAAYVAVREKARDAYLPNPDLEIIPIMSEHQRDSINVVLTRPEWACDISRALGGMWYDTGESLSPLDRGLFGGRDLGFVSWQFVGLRMYRKIEATSGSLQNSELTSVISYSPGLSNFCGPEGAKR